MSSTIMSPKTGADHPFSIARRLSINAHAAYRQGSKGATQRWLITIMTPSECIVLFISNVDSRHQDFCLRKRVTLLYFAFFNIKYA